MKIDWICDDGTACAYYISMKTALSVYADRIAPVFDTARDFMMIDGGQAIATEKITGSIQDDGIGGMIQWLLDNGVKRLVCGAISMPFQGALTDSGITLVSFVCGDVEEIVKALSAGDIARFAFTMPGCCGRGRGCHGGGGGGGGARHGRCREGRLS